MRQPHLLIALCFGLATGGCHAGPPAEEPARVAVVAVNSPPRDPPVASDEPEVEPPARHEADLEAGGVIFQKFCAACHGGRGQGLIGPNLTDRCYVHGHRRQDAEHIVTEGVPSKGMVAWGAVLRTEQIQNVVAYVNSIGGQNLDGKACEGEALNVAAPR